MSYYITVSKGPRADQAKPVIAISDPEAVAAVLRAVERLLSEDASGQQQGKEAGMEDRTPHAGIAREDH